MITVLIAVDTGIGTFQHRIDEAVCYRALCAEIDVPILVTLQYLTRLACVFHKNVEQLFLEPLELVGTDHQVRHLSLPTAAPRLVHMNGGIGQGVAHSSRPTRQDHGAETGGHADGGSADGRADLLN